MEKTYEEALKELEELVKQIENPQNSLAQMEESVKKAMLLIKYCKEKLHTYEGNMDKLAKFEVE